MGREKKQRGRRETKRKMKKREAHWIREHASPERQKTLLTRVLTREPTETWATSGGGTLRQEDRGHATHLSFLETSVGGLAVALRLGVQRALLVVLYRTGSERQIRS